MCGENIEEEYQDSFVDNLKSLTANAIDKHYHQLSDSALKKLSENLSKLGEVQFKKTFAENSKVECLSGFYRS